MVFNQLSINMNLVVRYLVKLNIDLCAVADLQLSHQSQTTASRHQRSTVASQPPPIAVRQVSAEAKLCQTAILSIEAVRNN